MTTPLRHRRGCDPAERSTTSCPCGATEAYRQHLDELVDDQENPS